MVGLEAIAEALEEPFGYVVDVLDLDRYCQTIEESVAEILGAPGALLSSSLPVTDQG